MIYPADQFLAVDYSTQILVLIVDGPDSDRIEIVATGTAGSPVTHFSLTCNEQL